MFALLSTRPLHIIFLAGLFISVTACSTTPSITTHRFSEEPIKSVEILIPKETLLNQSLQIQATRYLRDQVASRIKIKNKFSKRQTDGMSHVLGKTVTYNCKNQLCNIMIEFTNGKHMDKFGRFMTTQNINLPISFKKKSRFMFKDQYTATIEIPSTLTLEKKSRPIFGASSPLLSDSRIKQELSNLTSIPSSGFLDNYNRQLAAEKLHIEREKERKIAELQKKKELEEYVRQLARDFREIALLSKSVGEKICSSNNMFGYVERLASNNIQIRLRGTAKNKDDYYFFDSKRRGSFKYSKTSEIIWAPKNDWAKCHFD